MIQSDKSKNKKRIFKSLPLIIVVLLGVVVLTQRGSGVMKDIVVEERDIHRETPEYVYSVYMSACAAATGSFRKNIDEIVNETPVNSVVIDIKDFSGGVSIPEERFLKSEKSCVISDLREYIAHLHENDVYVIGRVTVFQDPLYAVQNREDAVLTADGAVWRDNKGLSFIDVGATQFWEYIRDVALTSYEYGIDEINFDYIRYPSDGNLDGLVFPHSGERLVHNSSIDKALVVEDFFRYLHDEFRVERSIPISADIFGQATINYDDLGIGHVLERSIPYFDAVAFMVYPSHFLSGINNIIDPNERPGEIISYTLGKAIARTRVSGYDKTVIRSWIQDFDYPIQYDAEKVRSQLHAAFSKDIGGVMLWDPSVRYTKDAFISYK